MKIELKAGINGFIPLNKVVTFPDSVIISVVPEVSVGHLVLSCSSAAGAKSYNADEEIDITELCTMPGLVRMTLYNYVDGVKSNEWHVEPLKIAVAAGETFPIPAIEDIGERVTALEKTATTLTEAIKELYKLYKE